MFMGILSWLYDFIYRTIVLFDGFRKQREEELKDKKGDKSSMSVGNQINDYTNLHEQDESQV
jgi:hypothetical protein